MTLIDKIKYTNAQKIKKNQLDLENYNLYININNNKILIINLKYKKYISF